MIDAVGVSDKPLLIGCAEQTGFVSVIGCEAAPTLVPWTVAPPILTGSDSGTDWQRKTALAFAIVTGPMTSSCQNHAYYFWTYSFMV